MDDYLTPIIEALARAEGVSHKALTPPLGVVIDADALTQLLASGTVRVTFAYEAYSVTVTSDGDVEVTPRVD
ncbi:MAG: HalOD1 output domain-containing protein [Halorubrum sp.]|uniref:HalOD1 output domain-containing protein n=1 Tax=Halorubrum sp. TaxID=1879286 RepID=UPI0039706841